MVSVAKLCYGASENITRSLRVLRLSYSYPDDLHLAPEQLVHLLIDSHSLFQKNKAVLTIYSQAYVGSTQLSYVSV